MTSPFESLDGDGGLGEIKKILGKGPEVDAVNEIRPPALDLNGYVIDDMIAGSEEHELFLKAQSAAILQTKRERDDKYTQFTSGV